MYAIWIEFSAEFALSPSDQLPADLQTWTEWLYKLLT